VADSADSRASYLLPLLLDAVAAAAPAARAAGAAGESVAGLPLPAGSVISAASARSSRVRASPNTLSLPSSASSTPRSRLRAKLRRASPDFGAAASRARTGSKRGSCSRAHAIHNRLGGQACRVRSSKLRQRWLGRLVRTSCGPAHAGTLAS
jgi:hypothetical protein